MSDVRESPALDIIYLLQQMGAEVSYHDPYVDALNSGNINLANTHLEEDHLRLIDLLLVVTNHSSIDWELIASACKPIIDTRNIMSTIQPENVNSF